MLKWRGFTLIEVLTTITILGIVATISAPEYGRWRDRDKYRAEGQGFFDTILLARNYAQTNKFCSNGKASTRWRVYLDTANPLPRYRLNCHWDDTNNSTVEIPLVTMGDSEIEEIDFNLAAAPAALSPPNLPANVQFTFFSGSAVGRLQYNNGSLETADDVQIVIGHDDTPSQHTICFNRVAGFPTFNKTGSSCQTY